MAEEGFKDIPVFRINGRMVFWTDLLDKWYEKLIEKGVEIESNTWIYSSGKWELFPGGGACHGLGADALGSGSGTPFPAEIRTWISDRQRCAGSHPAEDLWYYGKQRNLF